MLKANNEDYKIYLGLNKELLKRVGKTQTEIIEMASLNINRATLSNYINGDSIPPVDIVIKLANKCGCPMDDLLQRELYANSNPIFSYKKKVCWLRKDGTNDPVVAYDSGNKKKYLEFDFRKTSNPENNDFYHFNVFILDFDSIPLFAKHGSYVLTDFLLDSVDLFKEKDEFYVLIREGDKLYPSLIKRVKDEMGISNIKANIYSYTDMEGSVKLATINQLDKMIHSKIVKIIRDL